VSQEESETEFNGGSVADDRPVCAEEASTVLVTALKSFRQALMNYSDSNKEIVSELEAFFGPTKIMRALLLEKWLFWMHN
jgi:molecular chaperone GrpE